MRQALPGVFFMALLWRHVDTAIREVYFSFGPKIASRPLRRKRGFGRQPRYADAPGLRLMADIPKHFMLQSSGSALNPGGSRSRPVRLPG